jgi:hypothetical protein
MYLVNISRGEWLVGDIFRHPPRILYSQGVINTRFYISPINAQPGNYPFYANYFDNIGFNTLISFNYNFYGYCLDGTLYNQCSINKPKFCERSLQLTNKCNECGCPPGGICRSNGICSITTTKKSTS